MRRFPEVANSSQPLWRVKDASHYLGVPPKGIYALIETRELPCVRIGSRIRFIPEQLLAWVRSNRDSAIEIEPSASERDSTLTAAEGSPTGKL